MRAQSKTVRWLRPPQGNQKDGFVLIAVHAIVSGGIAQLPLSKLSEAFGPRLFVTSHGS